MSDSETPQGATAADPGPPAWLKTLLDQQAQQFQQLLTPVLQHVVAEQQVSTRATPTAQSHQAQYADTILPPVAAFHRAPSQPGPQTEPPFAAELEVIRQRSHNAGPTNHNPVVRRRDEQMSQHHRPAHTAPSDTYGIHGNSENRHDMVRQRPPEASKVKLATYDGKEDWD